MDNIQISPFVIYETWYLFISKMVYDEKNISWRTSSLKNLVEYQCFGLLVHQRDTSWVWKWYRYNNSCGVLLWWSLSIGILHNKKMESLYSSWGFVADRLKFKFLTKIKPDQKNLNFEQIWFVHLFTILDQKGDSTTFFKVLLYYLYYHL